MAEQLFSEEQRLAIKNAIIAAEKKTSGEIRVYIESQCGKSVLDRAAEVFAELGLHKTEQRNGILFYLAVEDRKFAVLGDKGINAVVPKGFWDETKELMQNKFRHGEFTQGLSEGIAMAGKNLIEHFPYHREDINELPDEVVFGK